jgi:hypothetical protein
MPYDQHLVERNAELEAELAALKLHIANLEAKLGMIAGIATSATVQAPLSETPIWGNCAICGEPTTQACSECALADAHANVCELTTCMDAHEADVHPLLVETTKGEP